MKLGKLPAKVDLRTRRLATYLTPELPEPPTSVDWGGAMSGVPMLRNDDLGCCTCSSMAHLIQSWTANNGMEECPSEDDVVQAYVDTCGYVPGDESTDNGGYMLSVLNYMRKVGMGGHKIAGYVSVDVRSRQQFKVACWLFGGVYMGLGLPGSAQLQPVWKVALSGYDGNPEPLSWGGHAVALHGYDETGLTVSTWDRFQRVSWNWIDAGYADEAYAIVSPAWAQGDRVAPSGLDFSALLNDLPAVGR
jgi:hypothetical protein